MNNKFQDFKNKLQENRKFQIQFVSVIAACVVVLTCAITIPVAVHTSNIKKAMIAEAETSANDIVPTEESTSAEATTEATTGSEETTTTAPTSAIADVENKTTENSNKNSNSGGSSNNGGSRGSSNNKPTTTKPVTTTKKETTTEDDRWNWTQADVDATVAEVKRYAISKGFAIDSSLTEVGTSWDNPVDTSVDAKTRGVGNLKYQVDRLYNVAIGRFGYVPEGSRLNVFSKNCGNYWEIYVVY